jgi:hypothetical protein
MVRPVLHAVWRYAGVAAMSDTLTKEQLVSELAGLVRRLSSIVIRSDWYTESGEAVRLSSADVDLLGVIEDRARELEVDLEPRE